MALCVLDVQEKIYNVNSPVERMFQDQFANLHIVFLNGVHQGVFYALQVGSRQKVFHNADVSAHERQFQGASSQMIQTIDVHV